MVSAELNYLLQIWSRSITLTCYILVGTSYSVKRTTTVISRITATCVWVIIDGRYITIKIFIKECFFFWEMKQIKGILYVCVCVCAHAHIYILYITLVVHKHTWKMKFKKHILYMLNLKVANHSVFFSAFVIKYLLSNHEFLFLVLQLECQQ
jgi:hypothetical protein